MTARSHRLAALCFADIAEYTELAGRNEDQALALVELLQGVARGAVEEHGGRIVKFLGDAILFEFPSTDAAVRSGIELRDRFASEALARGLGSRDLRVGVHVGDIVTAVDGDVYGDGVNVASRVQAAAEPGHVWVSEDVWRQLRQRPEFRFEPRGERELKGVATPVALYGVRLVSAAPGPAVRDMAQAATKAEPPAAPHKRSVAVLPFANMSASAENEYFSDGVTEEILALLAQVEGLKVISRTSIMRYKGTDKPMRQIAEELGVASILEGSVRQAGQRVRITAQLIDAATDQHLWAERYDRDLEDIFAIQTDVAERIVEALRVRLTPREQARLVERPTENVEAYRSYLKGRHFLSRRTRLALKQAVQHFQKAVTSDPSFALAWTGLAEAYALLSAYSSSPVPEALTRARDAAERALALDPRLGEAHTALGGVAWSEWKWEEAEAEYRRALELAPGYATAYHWYGILLMARRPEEAIGVLQHAMELDPVSLPIHMAMGVALTAVGRTEQAIEVYEKAIGMDPNYAGAHVNLASAYEKLDRYEETLNEWETLSRLSHERFPPDLVAEVRRGYESGGERGFREAYLEGLRTRPDLPSRIFDMAAACAQLGRADEAFALLDRLIDERSILVWQIRFDPGFDPVRSDPRFRNVLERLGLD
ncbi:MAG: tetratricopeptide repeat protein [Gemmatimonadetes bacterium]|nr:tetratricopeptide repeat protein [Gemmatimonadota bacterium]